MLRPFSIFRRLPRLTLVLAVVEVLAAAIAATAWYQSRQSDQQEGAGRDALAAATAATQALFSYDYRSFDASVSNGRQFVTGGFAKEYADTTASLKATAVKEQAVVQAQVSAARSSCSSTSTARTPTSPVRRWTRTALCSPSSRPAASGRSSRPRRSRSGSAESP